MGYILVNEVLDHAPPDLTSAERLLLVALAAYAKDNVGECSPGQVAILRRTGLSKDGLKKVFQRLAARGLDPRVPLKTDGQGRPIFAYEATQTKYRIPRFAKSEGDVASITEEGGPEYPLSTTPAMEERGPHSTPTSNEVGVLPYPHSETRGGTGRPKRGYSSTQEGVLGGPPKEERIKKEPHPPTPHAATQDEHPSRTGAAGEGIATATPFHPDALALVDRLRAVLWFGNSMRVEFAEKATRHLEAGWSAEAAAHRLLDGAEAIKHPGGWRYRLDNLGPAPTSGAAAPAMPEKCDNCDDRRMIEEERNGSPVMVRCPQCHPAYGQPLSDVPRALQIPYAPTTPQCQGCEDPVGAYDALCDRCLYDSEDAT